jgi:hypothetical protein
MSMIFGRTAIIPVWLVVFGLFAVSGSPISSATGVVLLLVGGVALTIMLALWNEPRPTMAAMPVPDPLAKLASADFAPNSWPNSGYRNSRQRGTRAR